MDHASSSTSGPSPSKGKQSQSNAGMSGSETGRKRPKKVNSELRKQQNRIASRNYREKRKRKLQYLKQLLRDESTEPQSGLSAESASDPRSRSVSAEYDGQLSYPGSFATAAPPCFEASLSPAGQTSGPNMPMSGPTEYLLPVASVPSNFSPVWTAPILQPQPQSPSYMWNVPQWMFSEPEAPTAMNMSGYQVPNYAPSYQQDFTPALDENSSYNGCQLPTYTTPQTVPSNVYQEVGSSHRGYSNVSPPIPYTQSHYYGPS